MDVFKIGAGSGLTFGKITKIFSDGFRIESDKPFAWNVDSGSVVLTRTNPSKILGIIILSGPCAENTSRTCVIAVNKDKIINLLS